MEDALDRLVARTKNNCLVFFTQKIGEVVTLPEDHPRDADALFSVPKGRFKIGGATVGKVRSSFVFGYSGDRKKEIGGMYLRICPTVKD